MNIIDAITEQVQAAENGPADNLEALTRTLHKENNTDSLLPDSRPVIILKEKTLDEVIEFTLDAASRATRGGEPFVFRKVNRADGIASELITTTPDGRVQSWHKGNAHELFMTMLQVIHREYYTKDGEKKYDTASTFPKDIAAILYDALLVSTRLPAVRIAASEPVLLSHGRAVSTPGYHAEDQVLITIPKAQVDFWKAYNVSEDVAREEALAAYDSIREDVLSDFPFATAADEAIAMAYLLTCVTRYLYGNSPAFGFDAPERGTGKSMLTACGRIVAQGHSSYATVGHRKGQDEETKKAVGALADKGGIFAHIDEMPRDEKVTSAFLSELVTAPIVDVRRLGVNGFIKVEGMMLTVAGPNIQLGLDYVRRFLKLRLHFQGQGTAARRAGFKHADLLTYVAANRAVLLGRLHTVVAWALQNRIQPAVGLGSYEQWTSVVGAALTIATVEHDGVEKSALMAALDAQAESVEKEDDLADEWGAVLAYWHEMLPEETFILTKDIRQRILHADRGLRPDLPTALVPSEGQSDLAGAKVWTKALGEVRDTPMVHGDDRYAVRRRVARGRTEFAVAKLP